MKRKGEMIKLKNGEFGIIHKVSIKKGEIVYCIYTSKGTEPIKVNDL
jgi:hypothetical protein